MMDNREIDILVARNIMGWVDGVGEREELAYLPGKGFCLPNKSPYYSKDLPHYSTDIAAAWQVVEKINSLDLGDGENYQILAKFINLAQIGDDRSNLLFLSSTQAAKRISLAALKAIGVEIEGEG